MCMWRPSVIDFHYSNWIASYEMLALGGIMHERVHIFRTCNGIVVKEMNYESMRRWSQCHTCMSLGGRRPGYA